MENHILSTLQKWNNSVTQQSLPYDILCYCWQFDAGTTCNRIL